MRKSAIFVLLLMCLSAHAVLAAVPQMMSYQGKLTTSSGAAVGDDAYNMRFSLYDQPSGGNLLWVEPAFTDPAKKVTISGGVFNVLLGGQVALPEAAFLGNTYLQIEVNGNTMSPRTQIVSAGYAIHALSADKIPDNSVSSAKIIDSSITTSKLASGAVTPDKLSTSGALTNQVLTCNGSNAVWANPTPLLLPFSGSTSGSSSGLSVTQTGTGKAAAFEITNTNSTASTLSVMTNGKGKAGEFSIFNTESQGVAVYAYSNGKNSTILAQNSGSGPAISASASGGPAAYFATDSGNTNAVISAETSASGPVVDLKQNAPANTSPGLKVMSIGSGGAIDALSYGGGNVGRFRLSNQNCPDAALYASTTGTGRVGDFSISNTSNSADALMVMTNGTGRAGYFGISNSGSANSALVASSAGGAAALLATNGGTGGGGSFQIINGSNSSPAIRGTTSGTGGAAYFETTNTSNTSPVLYAKSNGTGRAAQFAGDVQIDGKLIVGGGILPLAMGIINYDGTILRKSSNVASCAWDASNRVYRISFTGFNYEAGADICLVTPSWMDKRFASATSGVGGVLNVSLYDTTGASQQGHFCFVIY